MTLIVPYPSIFMKSPFLHLVPALFLWIAGSAFAQQAPIAEKTWPRSITLDEAPKVEVVKEDLAARVFVYRSPHYEFTCDSRLRGDVVQEFGRLFEATYLINCKLPLDIRPAPEPLRTIFHAHLFTRFEDYMRAGGMQGSAGVYINSKKTLMVPLRSLGVKMSGSGNTVLLEKNSDDDNETLIHEITHQMMNQWLGCLRIWHVEGSADYMSLLDYNRFGRFDLSNMNRQLKSYLQKMNPEGGGRSFGMVDLEELMNMEHERWAIALAQSGAVSAANYGSAALLTYYYYHLDGAGDAANMTAFMRGVENANSYEEEDALVKKHLMRNRTYAQLAEDVKTAFRKEGISITFLSAVKN